MFFDNSYGLIRILVVAPLAYVALVFMLRVSGKRTLSKMNAFDFIVTIALGSTLASTIVTESVALTEGLLGMGLLIAFQYVITWLSVRSDTVTRLVKAEPSLVFHQGEFLANQLKRCRVTESEVHAAVREQAKGSMKDIVSVVLETDGTFSVVTSQPGDRDVPIGVSAGHTEP